MRIQATDNTNSDRITWNPLSSRYPSTWSVPTRPPALLSASSINTEPFKPDSTSEIAQDSPAMPAPTITTSTSLFSTATMLLSRLKNDPTVLMIPLRLVGVAPSDAWTASTFLVCAIRKLLTTLNRVCLMMLKLRRDKNLLHKRRTTRCAKVAKVNFCDAINYYILCILSVIARDLLKQK